MCTLIMQDVQNNCLLHILKFYHALRNKFYHEEHKTLSLATFCLNTIMLKINCNENMYQNKFVLLKYC